MVFLMQFGAHKASQWKILFLTILPSDRHDFFFQFLKTFLQAGAVTNSLYFDFEYGLIQI